MADKKSAASKGILNKLGIVRTRAEKPKAPGAKPVQSKPMSEKVGVKPDSKPGARGAKTGFKPGTRPGSGKKSGFRSGKPRPGSNPYAQKEREKRMDALLQKTAEGTVVRVNSGFGFVKVEDREDDVFIPGKYLLGALPGDVVKVALSPSRKGGEEGKVIKITEPCDYKFSGTVSAERGNMFIQPDKGLHFPLAVRKKANALPGDKAVARIAVRSENHFDLLVDIIESFGSAHSAAACSAAILASAGIEGEFSPEQLDSAKQLSESGIHPKEIEIRRDLRKENIFTIDSEHSKDLDDAISVKKLPDGYLLGVHIADVSYYVTRDGVLDAEAYKRGTSVYYANRVVPMLPPEISNGICSLTPGEDRLTFSAYLTLDKDGNLTGYKFEKTVINSAVKGVYSEINRLLAGESDRELQEKYARVLADIPLLHELYEKLLQKRKNRGVLALESTETTFEFGADGSLTDIRAATRGISEEMIEEFMLTANEAAAKFSHERELPFIYRVHPAPAPAKADALRETVRAAGLSALPIKDGISQPGLNALLAEAKGTSLARLINNSVLRSMAKAKYSHTGEGHFGLVLDDYSHFTSPIRRYPDLAIHRIMSASLTGMKRSNIEKYYREFVADAAIASSEAEIRAMTAERDCTDCYKAEYMQRFIGESFEASVSGIISAGIFAELPNSAEGFISLESMPEGDYESDGIRLAEKVSGKTYKIGDPIKIKVISCNVSAGRIDFAPDFD